MIVPLRLRPWILVGVVTIWAPGVVIVEAVRTAVAREVVVTAVVRIVGVTTAASTSTRLRLLVIRLALVRLLQ